LQFNVTIESVTGASGGINSSAFEQWRNINTTGSFWAANRAARWLTALVAEPLEWHLITQAMWVVTHYFSDRKLRHQLPRWVTVIGSPS